MPTAEWADVDDAGWKLQWEEYADVVSVSCTPATHSPTGVVLDGCLELRCRFIPFDHSLHQVLWDFTFLDEYGTCFCEAQGRLYFAPVGSLTYKNHRDIWASFLNASGKKSRQIWFAWVLS